MKVRALPANILAMLWICTHCGNHLKFWDLGTASRLTLASKFSSSLKQSILIELLPAAVLLKPGRISLWQIRQELEIICHACLYFVFRNEQNEVTIP